MRYRNYFRLRHLLLLGLYLVVHLNSTVFGQSTSVEKPKIKDFGSSLKKYDRKNKDGPDHKQLGDKSSEGEVIKVKTDLVTCDVLVLDQRGNAILGLKQSDFIVRDDGVLQKIGMFFYGENVAVPRSIVLILDYSGSMSHYLETSIEAARRLVDKLGPQDRMAIVTDDVRLLVDFTNDKDLLKRKLKHLRSDSETSEAKAGWFSGHSLQYSALLATLRELFDEEDVLPIVIFQTDGDEFTILKPTNDAYKSIEQKFGFSDVLEQVEKSRATIYSIIPGVRLIGLSEQQYKENAKTLYRQYPWAAVNDKEIAFVADKQRALAEVASLSGGSTNFLERPEDADRVYSSIFDGINKRYLIGYYPNAQRYGKRHTVEIEVRDHLEYTVVGRKTYIVSDQ